MLIKEPHKRPSMRKILEKPFLSNRISKLLTMTIARNEFSNTFVTNHLNPAHSNAQLSVEEEKKGESVAEGSSVAASNAAQSEAQEVHSNGANVVVSKQKITLSKDASRKKKRIEVIQNNHGGSSNHNASVSAAANNNANTISNANTTEEDENGYI